MTPGVLHEMGAIRNHFLVVTGLAASTIFAGALVAEIDGGREFQTFPKMGGHWIPQGFFEQQVMIAGQWWGRWIACIDIDTCVP